MSITGIIKALEVPDDICFTTVRDLVIQLQRILAVEFDAEKITNVYNSVTEPDPDPGVLWIKRNNSGNIVGLFAYVGSSWFQFYPPPNFIAKMLGDSNDLPPGYALADENIPGISSDMATFLKTGWMEDPDDSSKYVIFEVVYVGV